MVYKKYIKKNGKLYGPYIYHSHRVNGKVVSEYRGVKKTNYKIFVFFILGLMFLALFVSIFYNFNGKITGSVVQNSDRAGILVYPKIYFTLISRQMPVADTEEDTGERNEEKQTNVSLGITEQDATESKQSNESKISENKNNIESAGIAEENATKEPQQNESREIIQNEGAEKENMTETTESSEQPSEQLTTESPQSNSDISDNLIDQTEPPSIESGNSDEQTAQLSEESDETSEADKSAPEQQIDTASGQITNIVLGVLKSVSNFFLGLKFTGRTVSEPTIKEIKGEVSADKPFTYSLREGESVELLSGSVKTGSKNLPDDTIQIDYQNNMVLVRTNYSEFVSNPVINHTANETASIINKSVTGDFNVKPLSEEEKEFLSEELGNSSVEIVKSELFNGRYIIGYKLDEYEIEYSYDSEISNETLKLQIENDKIKWLRDIINELSRNESIHEEVDLA